MTDRQIEERLRAWYRATSDEPPPSLSIDVAGIPWEARVGERPKPAFRHLFVAFALVLMVGTIAAGTAAVGAFLADPAPVGPDAVAPAPRPESVQPGLEGPFDACLALSAEAFDRLFPDVAVKSRGGGPELADTTGDWSPQMLGSPVRSCLYDAGETRIAVHVPVESTRIGEAAFIARRFLGRDFPADAWPWSVERGDGSAGMVLTRSSAENAGYLVGVTMRLGPGPRPELADIGVEIVNGLNPVLGIPDPCDLLAVATTGSPAASDAATKDGWHACAAGSDGSSVPRLLVYRTFVTRDRASDLVTKQPGVPDVGTLSPDGVRWGSVDGGSRDHAVAVSCEPILFVVTGTSTVAASDLADRAARLACPGRVIPGDAR